MRVEMAHQGNRNRRLADHILFSQKKKRENGKWSEARQPQILPIGYFPQNTTLLKCFITLQTEPLVGTKLQ